ncbi:MAG: ABC transporter permease, partial [Fibrobacterota bacterium]
MRSPSAKLMARLAASDPGPEPVQARPLDAPLFERIGRTLWDAGQNTKTSWRFGIDMFSGIFALLSRRERSWPGATWRQLHELGTTALPVVLLLTGLIGLTLALLMGQQLAQYGASVHLAT